MQVLFSLSPVKQVFQLFEVLINHNTYTNQLHSPALSIFIPLTGCGPTSHVFSNSPPLTSHAMTNPKQSAEYTCVLCNNDKINDSIAITFKL